MTDRWFSSGTPVSFTDKTYQHDIPEIVFKVALSTVILTLMILQGIYTLPCHSCKTRPTSKLKRTQYVGSCSTSGPIRVAPVKKPMISHKLDKDREVPTTSETYPGIL